MRGELNIMYDYTELIKEVKSITVVILPSIITAIITTSIINYKKRLGKIFFFLKEWDCTTPTKDEFGGTSMVKVNSLNVKDIDIMCGLNIINSSEINKIMRDIKIEFSRKKIFRNRIILSIIPLDGDTAIKKVFYYDRKEVNIINIDPQKCITKTFCINVNNDIKNLKNNDKVYISYINERNKKKKQLIKKNIVN